MHSSGVCAEMECGHSHPFSSPHDVPGTVGLLNPRSDQVISASGIPASFNLSQFAGHHDIFTSHAGPYNHHQETSASSHDVDSVGQSIFDNSYINASSSSNFFSIPVTGSDQLSSSSMMRVSRNHHFTDNARGSCKGKNVVQVPGDYSYVNDIPNFGSCPLSFSLNSGMQNWDKPFEVRSDMMDVTNFNAPTYRGGFLPLMEGPQRSIRTPDITHLQMESHFWHHHNHDYSVQGNYFNPMFQPGGAWAEQFRGNVRVCSMWNNPTMPYFEGSLDVGNMGGHQGLSFGRTAISFHSPSVHSQHHLQPMQSMQGPNYINHPRILAPYGLPTNNLLYHSTANTSREGVDPVVRIPRPFSSSTGEWSYRPHRHTPQAAADLSGNGMRILSAQDNAVLEFPGFYGAEDFRDRHRDMRLDIDNMSYEELLALEEQIGDVKTGLTEEAILKILKMRTFSTPGSLLNSSSDTAPEIGTCIICQVEYADNERIGTLRCGHDYHADCITQWLLVKNLCPICKTSALDADEREK